MTTIGVTGHGVGERLHIPVFRSLPDVHVRRIVMPRVSPAGEVLGPSPSTDDVGGLALVCVGSPPFAHEAHVAILLRLGVSVLCEKPVGLSSSTPAALRQLSGALGLPVAVNYQLRFHPCIERLRFALDRRGPLILHVGYHSAANMSTRPAWVYRAALGGGADIAVGSHLLDLVTSLRGRFSDLRCVSPGCNEGAHDHLVKCRLKGVTEGADQILIDVDTTRPYARFWIDISDGKSNLQFDLIGARCGPSWAHGDPDVVYPPEMLSSRGPGPWRLAFERFAARLSAGPAAFPSIGATLRDAEIVHEALRAVNS